jgi:predicted nuclease of predicted toxin-antitoxin system
VQLVDVAGNAGHEAYHVAHVGKAGWKDWNVVQYACEREFVLVTNNAADFRRLYASQPRSSSVIICVEPTTKHAPESHWWHPMPRKTHTEFTRDGTLLPRR